MMIGRQLAVLGLIALALCAHGAEGLGNARKHWAFQRFQKVLPPKVKQARWARNDIDRFVLARLEAAGLQPSAPADKATLIRRVYLT